MARLTKQTKQQIVENLRRGASAHAISATYSIDYNLAVRIQQTVADETKSEAASHRILLRQQVRNQLPHALLTLANINNGKDPDMQTEEGRERIALRLRAAQTILNFAKDFVADNILQMFTEKQDTAPLQQTIFDFAAEIAEDGSTKISATPRLEVIKGGKPKEELPFTIEMDTNE